MILRLWREGLQGLYQPAIIVTANVQPSRMTKSYHHIWNYRTGGFNSMMRLNEIMGSDGVLMRQQKEARTIFGVPTYIYRQLMSEGVHWFQAIAQESKRLQHENQMYYLVGYIKKRLEQRTQITENGVT